MTIFEFAKQMEKDGERYYRELASGSRKTGLKKIFNELADAEVVHYRTIEAMEQGKSPSLPQSSLLTNAKNIFASIDKNDVGPDATESEIDLYKKALDLELKSRLFYEQKAGESDNGLHKELFKKIAEQEQQHYLLMESMIEFLLRPYTWLENAEWNHLDEY